MVRPEAQLLRDYLASVRRSARRRAWLASCTDGLIVLAACVAALVALAGWSARGDLAARVGLPLTLLAVAAAALPRLLRARARARSLTQVARAIAGTQGPLREISTEREREQDTILRHELLGAAELWEALERDAATSPLLAAAYVRRIGIASLDLAPELALPRPRAWPRVALAGIALSTCIALSFQPLGMRGLALLCSAEDGRPPPPPQPVWDALVLVLDYPAHTRRPPRRVPNPSGALRVPAGTQVSIELDAAGPADAVRLVMTHDRVELATAPPPRVVPFVRAAGEGTRRWTAQLDVHTAGSWVIALLDNDDPSNSEAIAVAARRSEPMRIELEPDALPEVELLPLPQAQREANETDRVELRFAARDDFGVVSAELVYELLSPEGELERHRLPAGSAPGGGSRAWRQRYAWDLSAIPVEQRRAVSYWIEVRDNDPGLGATPLVGGPGKIAASARQQLLIHDEEAEHATNIRDLQTIRDAAVDLLAGRLTTRVFEPSLDELLFVRALRGARELQRAAGALLAMLAVSVDALAVDTMVDTREVEGLAGIHARLLELHRRETALHEQLPVDAELARRAEIPALLRKLAQHNKEELAQLEDEIIRLDDLVDGQIIAHIETLVARLQASQQKLVEKLEQLAAGDESVRPMIEQLEQRIREDLRRVQQAKSQLRKEVGEEWMNLDAFEAMEARMRSQELLERLRQGDVDGALEQARERLDEIRSLREQVQHSGSESQAPALSEEDRQRMKMLRELSRLQDEQTGLRDEAARLRSAWREQVADIAADEDTREAAARDAERMLEALEDIDDSNLSREGRSAWEDAREAYERLAAEAARPEQDPTAGPSKQIELLEAARDAAAALEAARAGAKSSELEAKALDKLQRRARGLEQGLGEGLPPPSELLDPEQSEHLSELSQTQQALRERASELLEDPAADVLPEDGRRAMQRSDRGMRDTHDALDDAHLDDALDATRRAWGGLQQAIDSLRQGNPPPPPAGGGEASTEADRDRSLRDEVVEAMREGDRDDFGGDTKRYYEELLR